MRRVLVAAVCVAAIVASAASMTGAGAATCNLVPQLRAITVNQGLGYPVLVRGKETLVRLFLSVPSCASRRSSIAVTGGSLTVKNGSTTLGTVAAPTPAPTSPYPLIAPYASAPMVDSTGDPKFVVPGSMLAPSGTAGAFTATFTATISYRTSAGTSGTATFTTLSGSTALLRASIAQRTNALRVLAVPMGDASQPFSATANAAVQNGFTALSRLYPIPGDVGSLLRAGGGIRYTMNAGMLDLRNVGGQNLLSGGMFCGTTANFNALKPVLAQFLQSWNSANPSYTADRVLGVVDEAKSLGASSGCAEGMAAVNGPEAWVRAIPDGTTPSTTGALMAMEIAHTLADVPPVRDDDFNPYHSQNVSADVPLTNRSYNLAQRSYLPSPKTALNFTSSWNQTNTLLEPPDYAYVLCKLGGPVGGDCGSSGAVGTATGVGASPVFVLSLSTDGTAAGTDVVESYFAPGPVSGLDPSSVYKLVQKRGTSTLRTDGLLATAAQTLHEEGSGESAELVTAPLTLISASVPFNSSATRIELWKGKPGAAGSVLLYARDRAAAPEVTSVTVDTGGSDCTPDCGTTDRISVSTDEEEGDAASSQSCPPAVSDDGRFVAFQSDADNLVDDGNESTDIFVRDRDLGTTERVSLAYDGSEANGASYCPSITPDGRFVAFTSIAPNLVPDDTNETTDTFVRDRQEETSVRVSLPDPSTIYESEANGGSIVGYRSISDDGNLVAFASYASNLVPNDTNETADVFVRNLADGTTELVSVTGEGYSGDGGSQLPSISGDGNFVAFESDADDLVGDDANEARDIFVRDLEENTTQLASVSTEGEQGNQSSESGVISRDGTAVAFESIASNLVGEDGNSTYDVFVHQLTPGVTDLVSVASSGAQGNGVSQLPSLSGEGRFAAFSSSADNLVSSDTNRWPDVFVHDRLSATTTRVSVSSTGAQADDTSYWGVVSGDGTFVAFSSDASNLVEDDTNGFTDVFGHTLPAESGGGSGGSAAFLRFSSASAAASAADPTVTATVTAASPAAAQNLRADLRLACPLAGGGVVHYILAVGQLPDSVSGSTATFTFTYAGDLPCDDGTLEVVTSDGFTTSPLTAAAKATPPDANEHDPVAAIAYPIDGSSLLESDDIALRGSGHDEEDGVLTGSALSWSLTGPVTQNGTGEKLDLTLPPGDYTATLTVTDSSDRTGTDTVSFHVLPDADHDGLSADQETAVESCHTPPSSTPDNDPTNAFEDYDGDGIPNVDDPSPCLKATGYEASVDFPAKFSLESTAATFAVKVRLPYRDLRQLTSVAITSIAGRDVDFPSLKIVVSGSPGADQVATVTFDRQALIRYLRRNAIYGDLYFGIEGTSSSDWSLAGRDIMFVPT